MTVAMTDCIFCKIAARQIPSTLLYENDEMVAFDDIHPAAPVHFLIVPKVHIETLADADNEGLIGRMLLLAPKLAMQKGVGLTRDASGLAQGGFKTLFNVGPKGGQEVFHLHLHVLGHQ